MRRFFDGFPRDAHPMAVLSSAVSALSTFYQDSLDPFDSRAGGDLHGPAAGEAAHDRLVRVQEVHRAAAALPGQLPGLRGELPAHDVRRAGRAVRGRPGDRPRCWTCCSSCTPTTSRTAPRRPSGWSAPATPTCSPRSRPGVNALFGPLHGGANQAVLEMLQQIHADGGDVDGLRAQGEGQGGRRQADGLRPPGLQELRPAGRDRQEGRAGRARPHGQAGPAAGHRDASWRRSRWPTTSSSRASSTRTWTSTPA